MYLKVVCSVIVQMMQLMAPKIKRCSIMCPCTIALNT